MFENARWIARERDWGEHSAPYLRKVFEIDNDVENAILNICGLGYGDYYINGQHVNEDVLTTPFTAYDKRVLYNDYNVTSFLKAGSNVIGIVLGNGFYNDIGGWGFSTATWRQSPKLILQLDIVYKNGSKKTVLSDSSFKSENSPIIYNHARCGEKYDANLEKDGWNTVEFNDTSWKNAVIASAPGGIIEKNNIPRIKEIEYLKPIKVENGVYYFAKNISGYAMIRVTGKKGSHINLVYSDRLATDGKADTFCVNRFNDNDVKHTDTYILKGTGTEEWKPRFVYHGFCYVEVQGEFESFEIQAVRVHTHIPVIGDFECSDEMINKIHDAARLSTLTNYFGIPTDCPHREQNGWTGDAQISAEQCLMNYDMLKLYRKWMNDFKDAQRIGGQLPGIIPNPAGWGFTSGGPAWDSTVVLIPYYVYEITHDTSIIEQMWDNMERYLNYLESLSENYLLMDCYSLWDWCPPPKANICPKEITDMSYFHNDCIKMTIMAKAIGKEFKRYEETAEKIKIAFRKRFIKDNVVEGDSQTAVACAIGEGFFEDDKIAGAVAHLVQLIKENKYHTDCGIIGIKYSFEVLSKYGYADVVYKMITNPTMPSYAYWINNGMTTLCEDWEMINCAGEDSSLNHHMFSDVDKWFYRYLAGIQISENGITIKPEFIEGLDWVKAHHNNIEVFWDKEQLTVKTDVPVTVIIKNNTYELKNGEHHFNR